jgi:hypothetical protein
MLDNLDKIKDRINSINGQFRSLKTFSDTKSGELFSKMLDFKKSQITVNPEADAALTEASEGAEKNEALFPQKTKNSPQEVAKLLTQGLSTPNFGLNQTPENNDYLQALLLNSIKNIKK